LVIITLLHRYAPAPLKYPKTEKSSNVIDIYHGKSIKDEYRWLEDDNSKQTKAWIQKQNAFTDRYIRKIPFRNKIEKRLTELWNYPTLSIPFIKGGRVYFYKNDGLQNQSVLYAKEDINDPDSSAVIVIDPNKLSNDGTVALSGIYFSNDNNYLGYSISNSGSDWREFHVKDLSTGEDLNDNLKWIKFSGMSWSGDGFYYNTYPPPKKGEELSKVNQNGKIFYHKIGTNQINDELIFYDPNNPRISSYPSTTHDGRFLMIYRSKGTYGNSIMVKDLLDNDSDYIFIVDDYNSEINIIDHVDGKLLAITDRNSPRKKIVLIDPKNPKERFWETIIPESENVLYSVNMINKKLIAHYMIDVLSEWYIFDLSGNLINQIKLPGPGISYGFAGDNNQDVSWYRFESLVHPPTIFKYNFKNQTSEVYHESKAKFKKEQYVMKQEFYYSKDNTRIPIFIAHHKDLVLDGMRPTLLYGYGGFNISIKPHYNKTLPIILENKGIYASANIRGGGEYGQKWHESGMLENKQNVFDDFIAAAEYLIKEGYTSTDKLAIRGGSNGGTLIGTVINQRPNLFRVAFPEVGVMDMLRYDKFTIGWAWIVEYGSAQNKFNFQNLIKISPLHNIKDQNYPSVLVYTADHDDRVVPAHSFKYTSRLQQHQFGDNPILIRIGSSTGHGAGKSTKKSIEEYAEKWSFMFYEMGVDI